MLLPRLHIHDKIAFTFNETERAQPQALLLKHLWRISNLTPCGKTPRAASAQFPALVSHPVLFILNVFHAGIQMQMQPELIPSILSVP